MMFILKTTLEEATLTKEVEDLKAIIKEMNGELTDSKEMGNRKFAYPINKEISGNYYVLDFNGSKELVQELDRKARINENVIRHMIIRLDEE